MATTEERLAALEQNSLKITEALSNTISAREYTTATGMLESQISGIAMALVDMKANLEAVTRSINGLTLRFKQYASDEEQVHLTKEYLPSQSEKWALAGTVGTPSDVNPFVTTEDARLSDERIPVAHAADHVAGGNDEIQHDMLAGINIEANARTHQAIDDLLDALISFTGYTPSP